MKSHLPCLYVTIVLLLTTGCSKPSPLLGPAPHPVHGKVIYQGKPARGFRVTLYPLQEFEKAKFAPSAVTDDNGEFTIRSYQPSDGAPPGEYAVTFSWPKHLNSGATEVDQLQGRYSNPRASRFKVAVCEGENAFDPFVLQ
jgi:5-hydroxyisourate hydrolase-like protein (transthyretin family)